MPFRPHPEAQAHRAPLARGNEALRLIRIVGQSADKVAGHDAQGRMAGDFAISVDPALTQGFFGI
jgi:hypothetical protein